MEKEAVMGYILDIHEAMNEHRRMRREEPNKRHIWDGTTVAQDRAIKAFVDLNGWREGRSFHPVAVGKKSSWYDFNGGGSHYFFDHPMFFKKEGRCFAIAAQPYNCRLGLIDEYRDYIRSLKPDVGAWRSFNDKGKVWLERMELDVYCPPDILASFHNPGSTQLFVVAPIGTKIKWLDDQEGRLIDRWTDKVIGEDGNKRTAYEESVR
jgi:hypothetical protein